MPGVAGAMALAVIAVAVAALSVALVAPGRASAASGAAGRVDPSTAPLVLRRGLSLFDQFGYAPSYTRNIPGFDSQDRPFIRSRGSDLHRTSFVHALGDGVWERRGLLAAVRAAFPTFKDTYYAAGWMCERIVFDSQDRAYTVLTIELTDGSLRNVLLASRDACRSWQVVQLPAGDIAHEYFVGHNRIDGPPFLGVFAKRAAHASRQANVYDFSVLQPRWQGDRVVVPAPVLVSRRCFGFGQHSGASSFAVTHHSPAAGRPLTHFVWGEVTASKADPGSPMYAATYDPQSGSVQGVTLIGHASVRDDMHCAPGICVDSRGHLHVVFGAHHTPMRYTVSLQPDVVTGGWSPAVDVLGSGYRTETTDADGLGRQTYASLVCDDQDTLHLVFRQYRRGVDAYLSGGGYMALAHQRRPAAAAGQPPTAAVWEAPRLLVVPAAGGYTLYYHKLTIDHGGRLFVSANSMSGAEWSRQRALVRIWRLRGRRGPRPGYYLHRFVLMSDDHGLSWRLAGSADLAAGVDDVATGAVAAPHDGRAVSTGDGSWLWLNRRPQGNAIGGLDFFDRRRGIAVGDAGTVLTTADGGRRWTVRRSPTRATLFAVDMVGRKLAWAVGDTGTIVRTANGGRSWGRQRTPTTLPLFGVCFVSRKRGWAVGEGGIILATADGGRHWRRQTSRTGDTLYAVYAVDRWLVWAVGDKGLVLRSIDGGRHWDRLRPRTTADGEDAEDGRGRTSTAAGVATGDEGDRSRAEAGGRAGGSLRLADVHRPPSGGRAARLPALFAVHFVSARRGWAVGEAGTVLTTSNGGRTWRTQRSRVKALLSGVRMVDARVGWIVGADGTTLVTRDGGRRWKRLRRVMADLYAVSAVGAGTGWVGGDAGMLLQFARRGASRRLRSAGSTAGLYGAVFTDAAHGMAVGAAGRVLRTADGGASWIDGSVPATGPLRAVAARGAAAVAVGDAGAIARSTDGGASWRRQASPTWRTLRAVTLVDATRGWAVGDGGTMLRTADGGSGWSVVSAGTADDLSAVAFPSASAGFVGGGDARGESDAVVLRTVDGGLTWERRVLAASGMVTALSFASPQIGWAAGYDMGPDDDEPRGFVARTADGGLTWSLAYLSGAGPVRSLTRTSSGSLLTCGDRGVLLRSADGGVTWTALRSGAAADLHAVVSPGGAGYVVGAAGTILKSTTVP